MPDSPAYERRYWLFATALAIPLLLLLSLGLFNHQLVQAVNATQQSARHFDELDELAEQVLIAMIDNEAGQRGFVLAQKELFLEPYYASLRRLPELRPLLQTQAAPHANLRPKVAALEAAVEKRLAFSEQTVVMQQAGQHEESVALVATGKGKVLMDKVRVVVAELREALRQERLAQAEQYRQRVAQAEQTAWLSVAVECLLAIAVAVVLLKVRRDQRILHVCAWSKAVEYKGEWITFEKYLEERFQINVSHGISPVEAEKVIAARQAQKRQAAA